MKPQPSWTRREWSSQASSWRDLAWIESLLFELEGEERWRCWRERTQRAESGPTQPGKKESEFLPVKPEPRPKVIKECLFNNCTMGLIQHPHSSS